jgi:hypothetical protein
VLKAETEEDSARDERPGIILAFLQQSKYNNCCWCLKGSTREILPY